MCFFQESFGFFFVGLNTVSSLSLFVINISLLYIKNLENYHNHIQKDLNIVSCEKDNQNEINKSFVKD